MSDHTITTERRELAHRMADRIEVRLLWSPEDDTVSIAVRDHREDEGFELEVEPEHALHAFHHPYAYEAQRRPHERRPALAYEP
jgi:hypothetical protein